MRVNSMLIMHIKCKMKLGNYIVSKFLVIIVYALNILISGSLFALCDNTSSSDVNGSCSCELFDSSEKSQKGDYKTHTICHSC